MPKSVETIKKYQASCFNFSEGIVQGFWHKDHNSKDSSGPVVSISQKMLALVSTVVQ